MYRIFSVIRYKDGRESVEKDLIKTSEKNNLFMYGSCLADIAEKNKFDDSKEELLKSMNILFAMGNSFRNIEQLLKYYDKITVDNISRDYYIERENGDIYKLDLNNMHTSSGVRYELFYR